MANIKAPLVLTLICAVSCGILIWAYNTTYVDTTGVITDDLQTALSEIYGTGKEYVMHKNEDGTVVTHEGVLSVISSKAGGAMAFEIVADGYKKDGLHLLVGIENGEIAGIGVVEFGDTPGVGTKATDKAYLEKFKGLTSADYSIDAVAGATLSSNGVKNAVELALNTFQQHYNSQ
ncbi:MAG: FMN-binding protein [Oscillospiraceae bacterium]|jgi:electron transport complex protein RnfG|nr:FMN-binding protein [Oscillospiraceae bacterium]